MKRTSLAVLFFALALVGCTHSRPADMFHVVSADPCDRPSVVGVMGDKEYALNVQDTPLYLACPSPLKMDAVGKDFPATVDLQQGVVTIQLPDHSDVLDIKGKVRFPHGSVRFLIDHVREVSK